MDHVVGEASEASLTMSALSSPFFDFFCLSFLFSSTQLHSLRRVVLFGSVKLCFDDHGSFVIFRSVSVRPRHLIDPKVRVAVGTTVACRPPHRPARAVFLHAVLTADTWRRSAGRGTDGGFGAGEATVQRNQSCASTSSGFSGYDVGEFVASVCSLHAESARD